MTALAEVNIYIYSAQMATSSHTQITYKKKTHTHTHNVHN